MKTTDIKLVVCDLDHTLLHNNKKISKESAEYLIHLQQRGLKLAIATGRFLSETEPYIKQLQLAKYGGYAITSNGTTIHDIRNKTDESFEKLKKEETDSLIKLGKQFRLNMYVHINDTYYVQGTRILKTIYRLVRIFIPILRIFLTGRADYVLYRLSHLKLTSDITSVLDSKDLHKICFISLTGKLPDFEKEVLRLYSNKYHFFTVNSVATELVHSSVSKKTATQHICRKLNLTMDNVIAFGDSGNDESLLAAAKIGVTMKNGYKHTVKIAKLLSDKTNNEDGVIDYLRKLKIG
ncbi:MAG: HAD-IIB family hydrolase [Erysipelotrichaceae bacterium]